MIRRLSRSIREYKRYAILAPLMMVGEVAMEVLIPTLMAGFMDSGVKTDDMSYVLRQGGLLLLCAMASLCFGILSATFASRAAAGFAKNLRKDMFYKVQTYSFANMDRFSLSSIVTRLTTDVANLQNAFQVVIRMAIRCGVMLILALTMALRISPRLCVIYCVVMPLLAFGLFFVIGKVRKIFDRVFKTYDRLNNVVQENLHGIRVVKSFVREEREKEKFRQVSGSIFRDFVKAEHILAFNNPMMQTAAYACMLLISWFGAKLVLASGDQGALGLTTGQLSSMFTYTQQVLGSLMMLSMVFVMITMSRAAGRRAVELLEEMPDLVSPEDPVTQVADGSIDFEHVSFRYSKTAKRDALEGVDLHIRSGMTVGILGGTGASKSTLVQLIPRLYDATDGVVKVGGVDVRRYDLGVLRDQVAMVLQKNVLFSGTIADNLRWGNPQATQEELVRVCRLACADEFIQRFPEGYETHLEQGGTNVSGGQKQRLCIARALLKKPRILILDDSTSAVDTATDARIRQAFREEIPDTTKLIIAQRVASVEHADLILVLEDGRIVDQGTHEELLNRSVIYQEVYQSQKKGGEEDAPNSAER